MTYEELLAENQQLRIRIKELEQENARLKGRDVQLLSEPELPAYSSRMSMTVEEKEEELKRRVTLFRSLFKGRENCEIFRGNLLRHFYASKTKSLTQKRLTCVMHGHHPVQKRIYCFRARSFVGRITKSAISSIESLYQTGISRTGPS